MPVSERMMSGDLTQPEDSGIGTRVRAARGRLGWSREALAFHSEISWSSVAQIESGPAWSGASDSEIRLWTHYESLVNLVFASWPVTLLCAYDERSVEPEIASQARVTHPHTIGPGPGADSPDYLDPAGFVLEPGS
jgi:DNA-binding XRE family transcriptional regulator